MAYSMQTENMSGHVIMSRAIAGFRPLLSSAGNAYKRTRTHTHSGGSVCVASDTKLFYHDCVAYSVLVRVMAARHPCHPHHSQHVGRCLSSSTDCCAEDYTHMYLIPYT